jgi:predicted outer membrane repeat protein
MNRGVLYLTLAAYVVLASCSGTPAILGVTIDEGSRTVLEGGILELSATVVSVGGADASILWSSSKPEVASIDETSGVVTAHLSGIAMITATSSYDVGRKDSINLTVLAKIDAPDEGASVTVSVVGSGRVTSGDGQVDCTSAGGDCTATYASGDEVALMASPDEYARFERWSGACSGASPWCTLEVLQDRVVEATFVSTAIVVTSASGGTSSSACTLRDAIAAANRDEPIGGCPSGDGADRIVLPEGATITLGIVDNSVDGPNGLPSIYTEIEIVGHGATIERDGAASPFRIMHLNPMGDVTLRDLTLAGGFDDMNLRDKGDPYGAGGILSRGDLVLHGVTIEGNTTLDPFYEDAEYDGPSIATWVAGGIFSEAGNLLIADSVVRGNESWCARGCAGGMIALHGQVDLRNSVVSGNRARGDDGDGDGGSFGGGLQLVEATADIEATRFERNWATGQWWSRGGGLYVQRFAAAELRDVTFVGNYANREGGGIWNLGTVRVHDSQIGGTSDWGGGVYNLGTLYVANSTIEGRGSFEGGGGIYNLGRALLTATTVRACSRAIVNTGNGLSAGDLTLTGGSTAYEACASGESPAGGRIVLNDSHQEAPSSPNIVMRCVASTISGGRDGGVLNRGATFYGDRCIIENNQTKGHGGGIYTTATVFLSDSVVRGNVADADGDQEGDGGGIYASGDAQVRLSATTLGGDHPGDGNSAHTGGGVYIGGGASVQISGGSEILGNFASSHGGGVAVTSTGGDAYGYSLNVHETVILLNTANIDGGGIYLLTGRANFSYAVVTDNVADVDANGTGWGGGLYVGGQATYTTGASTIEDNAPDDIFEEASP